jgi:outer membrane protein OmpA-like peptidoglycan-associated protein
MKRRLLVGSALGLLMAAAPALAGTSAISAPDRQQTGHGAILMAQDDPAQPGASEEVLPKKKRKQAADQQAQPEPQAEPAPQRQAEQPSQKKRKHAAEQQAQPEPQAEPAPQLQAEEPLPKKKRKQAAEQQAQPEPQAEPAPQQQAEEPLPKKKHKQASEQQAQPEPQAEPAPQQAEEPLPQKKRKQASEQQAQPEPQAEPAPQQAEEPLPQKKRKQAAEQQAQPEPQAEPAPAQQAEQPQPTKPKQAETETAPVTEGQAADQPKAKGAEEPGQQAGETQPGKKRKPAGNEPEVQTGEQAAPAPLPKPEVQPNPPAQQEVPGATTEQPATGKPKNRATDAAQPETPEATTGTPPKRPVAADEGTAEAQPENAAPVLDSAKEVRTKPDRARTGTAPDKPRRPAVPPAPPPTDDRAAQAEVRREPVETVTAERGRRIKEAPPPVPLADNRPQGVDVLREIGDRVLLQINNQIVVESSDRPRLERGARDVYYEDLGRGRTRETVVRADGTQVVTIRNRYGDIVRRSRITADGREYVIAYVDDRDYQRLDDWRDPGDDLPPLQLDVPLDEYVLNADNVEDPDAYYRFLERPPVERVERLYSVDEVRRSARIRDKVPRIELDTITFEFGSASIGDDQISRLQGVADAMERLLKKNPAESFLIEGHTDAVGTDQANLALSDRRAEAVAQALTNVFGIPPENLATQGYGERYLKIKTDQPERLNRRVVMRRITPLVAPVASAQ